mgnify:CR=1 FL=1
MDLADEITLNAPKSRVYAALNDPEILRQSIPSRHALPARSRSTPRVRQMRFH